MGKRSRSPGKRSSVPDQVLGDAPVADPVRQRRNRRILLITIPIVTLALALGAAYGLDSRPLAGIATLVGTFSWVLMLAANLGAAIPPRTGQGSAGINFGRR